MGSTQPAGIPVWPTEGEALWEGRKRRKEEKNRTKKLLSINVYVHPFKEQFQIKISGDRLWDDKPFWELEGDYCVAERQTTKSWMLWTSEKTDCYLPCGIPRQKPTQPMHPNLLPSLRGWEERKKKKKERHIEVSWRQSPRVKWKISSKPIWVRKDWRGIQKAGHVQYLCS